MDFEILVGKRNLFAKPSGVLHCDAVNENSYPLGALPLYQLSRHELGSSAAFLDDRIKKHEAPNSPASNENISEPLELPADIAATLRIWFRWGPIFAVCLRHSAQFFDLQNVPPLPELFLHNYIRQTDARDYA
jgi:hypothetical protein